MKRKVIMLLSYTFTDNIFINFNKFNTFHPLLLLDKNIDKLMVKIFMVFFEF